MRRHALRAPVGIHLKFDLQAGVPQHPRRGAHPGQRHGVCGDLVEHRVMVAAGGAGRDSPAKATVGYQSMLR